MAFTANAIGRVRVSGNDANGAFFDPSLTTNMLTDLTTDTNTGNTASPVVSSASYNFGAGDVGNYVFIASGTNWIPGWYKITSVASNKATVDASAGAVRVWTPTTTNPKSPALTFNTVAGCASTGTPTSGTFTIDYTQQDAAKLSVTDGTSTNSTTITSTTGGFTKVMIGNALRISAGTGATTGYRFITNQTDTNTVTVDSVSGTYTTATVKVGGAAATIARVGNSANTTGDKIVAGNIVYIRGAGTDTPSTDDYTTTGFLTPPNGDQTSGYIKFIGENGRPRLKSNGLMWYSATFQWYENLYVTASSNSNGTLGILNVWASSTITNVVFDTANQSALAGVDLGSNASRLTDCEIKSGTTSPTSSSTAHGLVMTSNYGSIVARNRIHHMRGDGINLGSSYTASIRNNLIYANVGNGITIGTIGSTLTDITFNTIDGNQGDGIVLSAFTSVMSAYIHGNLITNHNQSGKYGINFNTGSARVNDIAVNYVGYNWLYNSGTSHYNNLTQPATDSIDVDPQYTDRTNGDFSLKRTSPCLNWIQDAWRGQATPVGYRVPGAVQANAVSPVVVNRNTNIWVFEDELEALLGGL
jgi:hypothetical protein